MYEFDGSHEVTLSHYPRLGVVALVVGFGVSAAIFSPIGMKPGIHFLLAGTLLLMAAGIKDDLLHLSEFMRLFVVVAAGAIMTDAGRLPLLLPSFGLIGNYPVPGLLLTYGVFVGSVLLLLAASRIPGLVSVILIVCAEALAINYYRIGLGVQAVIPLALAGASVTLFFSAITNYVYEGRGAALAGGFILGVLMVNMGAQRAYHPDAGGLISIFFALVLLPVLVLTGLLKHEGGQVFLLNKKIDVFYFFLAILIIFMSISSF